MGSKFAFPGCGRVSFNPICCWWLIRAIQNDVKKKKMTETLAYGYSSQSMQRELSNEYQVGMVKMVFKNLCVLVLLTKVVVPALEGFKVPFSRYLLFVQPSCTPILWVTECSCQ